MSDQSASRRGIATRERLLAVAMEAFATRGYHGTTTALLAERGGIAEGTIYRHFEGKDALYWAVCRLAWERGVELALAGEAERQTTRDRLAGIGQRLVQEAHLAPGIVRLVLRLPEHRLDEPAERSRQRFREVLQQVVAAGKQEGAIRAGSADLWASLWLAMVGAACERVAVGDWPLDHPNVGLTLDAAWEVIRRGAPAPPGTA